MECLQCSEQRKCPKSHGRDGASSGGARHDARAYPVAVLRPERGAQSISQLEIVAARLSDVDQLDDESPAGSTARPTPFAAVRLTSRAGGSRQISGSLAGLRLCMVMRAGIRWRVSRVTRPAGAVGQIGESGPPRSTDVRKGSLSGTEGTCSSASSERHLDASVSVGPSGGWAVDRNTTGHRRCFSQGKGSTRAGNVSDTLTSTWKGPLGSRWAFGVGSGLRPICWDTSFHT